MNKPFGGSRSPETTEESVPSKITKRATEQFGNLVTTAWEQLLGVPDASPSHKPGTSSPKHEASQSHPPYEAKQNQPETKLINQVLYQLGVHGPENTPQNSAEKDDRHIEGGINYRDQILHYQEKSGNHERKELFQKIDEIKRELQELIKNTKLLQIEFGSVAVEPPPQNPGKYHENFFEWLLIMVKQARQKVENSSTWLRAVKGKNSKDKGYWDRAEKEGTTFTQNNERSVSTSVG